MSEIQLYPQNSFSNRRIAEIYEIIIIQNQMDEEPFHSCFTTFLYIVDRLNLHMKVTNSKEYVINVRNKDNSFSKIRSYLVCSSSEALRNIIKILHNSSLIVKDAQVLLLSLLILAIKNSEFSPELSVNHMIDNCIGQYDRPNSIIEYLEVLEKEVGHPLVELLAENAQDGYIINIDLELDDLYTFQLPLKEIYTGRW